MTSQHILLKKRVSLITERYRLQLGDGQRPAPLRYFADWLSDALLSSNRRIYHQSIKNWSDMRYLPDRSIMKQIAAAAMHDQRGDFAQDILAAIDPEGFRPASVIGEEVLGWQERQAL